MKKFSTQFPKTFKLLNDATGDVFPAYSVGVYFNDEEYYDSKNCSITSLFDLASLTKVLCTTTLYAMAEEKALISIEEPIKNFFPTFKEKNVKLSHLLDHSSGFPAWLPLHELFHDPNGRGKFNPREVPKLARKIFEEEILKSWIPADFEKKVTYSDLGLMLAGWALEKKLKTPLDALFQEWIAIPGELESLQFLPTTPDVLPTEMCQWRGRLLRGEAHDDNCYVLGGIAAHAGLFGNVEDVVGACLLWLAALHGEQTLIIPGTAHKYWTFTHIPHSVRSLGWDGISKENSSTGDKFSKNSKGHLGYTGTSVWIDPDKNLIVALLTNRVSPTRTNEKIKTFRPLFNNTLLEELGFGS